MSSESEDGYSHYRRSNAKQGYRMHSSGNGSSSPSVPSMNRLRLHDERHRSPSPGHHRHKQYHSSGDRKHGRMPSPRKEYSRHDSRQRHKEERYGHAYSSSPEDEYSHFRREGFKQGRISSSGLSSPSPPRSVGDPNIPERRVIPKQKTDDDVLQKMERSFTDGPLNALKRCVHEDIKVMVWIRNQNGIRGICTGYVLAFDKFWNLVMRDVDEAYQKSRKPKCPYLKQNIRSDDIPEAMPNVKLDIVGSSGKKSKAEKPETTEKKITEVIELEGMEAESSAEMPKQEDPEKVKRKLQRKQKKLMRKMRQVCKRNINSMFLRGDNIVLIRICD